MKCNIVNFCVVFSHFVLRSDCHLIIFFIFCDDSYYYYCHHLVCVPGSLSQTVVFASGTAPRMDISSILLSHWVHRLRHTKSITYSYIVSAMQSLFFEQPGLEFLLLLPGCRHGVIITSSSEMIHHWNFPRCGHQSPARQNGVSSVAVTRSTKGNNIALEMSRSSLELYVYFLTAS